MTTEKFRYETISVEFKKYYIAFLLQNDDTNLDTLDKFTIEFAKRKAANEGRELENIRIEEIENIDDILLTKLIITADVK